MAEMLGGADVASSPSLASPDRALVFDVVGPVADFRQAAAALGLEWLTEDQPGDTADDEDSEYDEEEAAGAILYVTMPSLDGLQRVLALWRRYTRGEARGSDARAWWTLFGYLRDVRTWSARDRVDPLTVRHLDRLLERHPDRPVRVELDLWFREDPSLRAQARDYVEALVAEFGGTLLDFATVEEIAYQAALVELPVAQALALRDLRGPIVQADRVMRIRPQSLYEADDRHREDPDADEAAAAPNDRPTPRRMDDRPIVAALLDGYPIANHELLANRLRVQEVDVTAATVPVARRFHGTAMASLILHGDLGVGEDPLDRGIISVPILAAPQALHHECTPLDRLPIPIVLRAVTALVVGLGDAGPAAPAVVVVNHSVCDIQSPFAKRASPWARLLDYLSHRHQLLFVVSAGNSRDAFEVHDYADLDALNQADPISRQVTLLRAVERSKGTRSILSPAESVNALTVGALHEDGSGTCAPGSLEPFDKVVGVANIASSAGLGVNRGIKPDVVEAGGRQMLAADVDEGVLSVWAVEHGDNGQLAASADPHGGSTSKLLRSTGTSNAAALVTRSAIRLADVVEEVFAADGENWTDLRTRAVVLKTLLAHGCRWGDTYDVLNAVYPPAEPARWQRRREAISRFLGYGRADTSRVIDEGGHRITLLADDLIGHDGRHEYRVPIPRAMINNREVRRVVITLAWSSPIDPLTNRYRAFALEVVDPNGKRAFWHGVQNTPQPHVFASRRGTLQHMVLEGKKLVTTAGTGEFSVGVQARSAIPSFEDETVPYALAITLELAQPLRQDLHADVAARIRSRPRVAAPVRSRVRAPR